MQLPTWLCCTSLCRAAPATPGALLSDKQTHWLLSFPPCAKRHHYKALTKKQDTATETCPWLSCSMENPERGRELSSGKELQVLVTIFKCK